MNMHIGTVQASELAKSLSIADELACSSSTRAAGETTKDESVPVSVVACSSPLSVVGNCSEQHVARSSVTWAFEENMERRFGYAGARVTVGGGPTLPAVQRCIESGHIESESCTVTRERFAVSEEVTRQGTVIAADSL